MKIINTSAILQPNLPLILEHVEARGMSLLSNGHLGADLIYLLPNQSFPTHTHPADHLLLVLQGAGTITIAGEVYQTKLGDLYMVEGGVEHSVGASADGHYLLSIGAPHINLDDPSRMQLSET